MSAGDHGLDRVRQRLGRPASRATMSSSSKQEQRVPAGAARDLLDIVRAAAGCSSVAMLDDLGRVRARRAGSSVERRGSAAPSSSRASTCVAGSRVRDDERVPARLGPPREPPQQVGARVVHELRVLDDEHRPACPRDSTARKRIVTSASVSRRKRSSSALVSGRRRADRGRAGCRAAGATARASGSRAATASRRRASTSSRRRALARGRARCAAAARSAKYGVEASYSSQWACRTATSRRAAR